MEDMPSFLNEQNNVRDNVNGYHNANGKFAAGNPGKPHGSKKNKLRDEIKNFVSNKWTEFPTWFDGLKNKEKVETLLALLPFVVSRLQSVAMSEDLERPKASIDYTKLRPETLKEILSLTQNEEHE